MTDIANRGYARPDALVSTEWVAAHLSDPGVRVVESNEDPLLYPSGAHSRRGRGRLDARPERPGAPRLPAARGLRGADGRASARRPRPTVVFYGDKNNWWACYAFWVFQLFGHTQRPRHGRRPPEVGEGGPSADHARCPRSAQPSTRRRRATTARSAPSATRCCAHVEAGRPLVDVRSPDEFTGERLHMPDYPNEGALRGGHIPGAQSVPVGARRQRRGRHVQDGATSCARSTRRRKASTPSDDVIAYCRIGER